MSISDLEIIAANLLFVSGQRAFIHSHEARMADVYFGRPVEFRNTILKPMAPNRCHENSALLWLTNPTKYQIMTGYALKESDWWSHSWVMDKDSILETTVQRKHYFGYVVADPARFCFENMTSLSLDMRTQLIHNSISPHFGDVNIPTIFPTREIYRGEQRMFMFTKTLNGGLTYLSQQMPTP